MTDLIAIAIAILLFAITCLFFSFLESHFGLNLAIWMMGTIIVSIVCIPQIKRY